MNFFFFFLTLPSPPFSITICSFSLSVEVFDLQSALLHFYSAVLSSVDLSQGPMSDPVQCHLVPLIPAIQDSATLYDLIFKLMKTLHAGKEYSKGLGGKEGKDKKRFPLFFSPLLTYPFPPFHSSSLSDRSVSMCLPYRHSHTMLSTTYLQCFHFNESSQNIHKVLEGWKRI